MEVVLAGIALAVAVVTLVPTTLGWWEARQQRRRAERAELPQPASQPALPAGVWRCGIYDYPPLSIFSPFAGVEARGPLVDLAAELAKALSKEIKYITFSYRDFYSGKIPIPDLVMGMFDTKRRAATMAFSRPIYEIGLQGICRIDQEGDVLAGLRDGDLRVAVYDGEVGWEFVHDELPDVVEQQRVAEIAGGRQLDTMSLLTQGEYDVVIMDALACANFLAIGDHAARFKMAFAQSPKTYSACVAVKKEHAHLLPRINATIEAVRNAPSFLETEDRAMSGYERIIAKRGLRSLTSRRTK